ncbi:hypothetical protein [Streptomyces ossamyceticus]|nr:hypothetical protein [Streptomyces ossamyceticus]
MPAGTERASLCREDTAAEQGVRGADPIRERTYGGPALGPTM